MKKAVIIEDDTERSGSLIKALQEAAPHLQVHATLHSVKQSLDYFKQYNNTDIIVSKVQLTDGAACTIFNELNINTPVIFVSEPSQQINPVHECNSICYLTYPVCKEDLFNALNKYKKLEQHFTHNNHQLNNHLHKKKRVIVKNGTEHISLPLKDAVLFYTEQKLTYVYDKRCRTFVTDKNLSELECELDGNVFFRANRQYLININYVRAFKHFEKVKLLVEMEMQDDWHQIVISQETAPLFKKWLANS